MLVEFAKKNYITLFWFTDYPKRVIYPRLRSTDLSQKCQVEIFYVNWISRHCDQNQFNQIYHCDAVNVTTTNIVRDPFQKKGENYSLVLQWDIFFLLESKKGGERCWKPQIDFVLQQRRALYICRLWSEKKITYGYSGSLLRTRKDLVI